MRHIGSEWRLLGTATRTRGAAIRLGLANRRQEPLDVVATLAELIREQFHRGRRRGLAIGSDVVHQLIESFAHQFRPEAIDHGRGEPLAVGQPPGKLLASPGVGRSQGQAVSGEEKSRLHFRAGRGGVLEVGHEMLALGAIAVILGPSAGIVAADHHEGAFRDFTHRLHSDAGEEGSQFVELLAPPTVVGMIVALGTLNLNAEKNPRHLGGRLLGAPILCHDDRSVAAFEHVAARGNELAGDPIPGDIFVELLREIGFHRERGDLRSIVQGSIKHHVSPIAGPILTVRGIVEQLTDHPLAFVGRLVEHESDRLLGSRDVADQIEPHSPQEDFVARGGSQIGVFAEDLRSQHFVDAPGNCRGRWLSQRWRANATPDHRNERFSPHSPWFLARVDASAFTDHHTTSAPQEFNPGCGAGFRGQAESRIASIY